MNSSTKKKFLLNISIIIMTALLITGNLIGAGILGLPVNTGLDGFIPSLCAMLIFGAAMFFSASVLASEAVETKENNFNYPSLYGRYLGKIGKWIAILANMLILYGLLTAYLTGGATIITQLFGFESSTAVILIVFVILSALTMLGSNVIQKYNVLLMFCLWLVFAVLVVYGEKHSQPARLEYMDWGFLPVAIPIIVTSFHFHNIIPTICRDLKWDLSKILKAMLLGMIVGYIMNAVWIQVGVGVIPVSGGKDSLLYAFKHNIPSTVPMVDLIHSEIFKTCSMLFALLAITTSFIANGMGLFDFNTDLGNQFLKNKKIKIFSTLLTFIPPVIIAVFYPQIFLKAINLVGGVGIVVLFGILPSIICFKKSEKIHRKILATLMFILFSAVLVFQICEEAGIIDIQPSADKLHEKTKTADNKD